MLKTSHANQHRNATFFIIVNPKCSKRTIFHTPEEHTVWPADTNKFMQLMLLEITNKQHSCKSQLSLSVVRVKQMTADAQTKSYLFINSFIYYPEPLSFLQGRGGLGPIPAYPGRRRGSPWTSRQFITGLTYGDKQPFMLTFAPTINLESPPNLHVV